MLEKIQQDLAGAIDVYQAMSEDVNLQKQLMDLIQWCLNALRHGGKIIFAGNGGSFADSQHLAAEFVSRLQFDRAPLAAIALATNSSSMSAIGNDYGYEQVFSRELQAIGSANDVFIPITTSGNSHNIIAAIDVARKLDVRTMCFTGKTGGRIADICPCLHVPSTRTERIQEGHILLGHILCGIVEAEFFQMGHLET